MELISKQCDFLPASINQIGETGNCFGSCFKPIINLKDVEYEKGVTH